MTAPKVTITLKDAGGIGWNGSRSSSQQQLDWMYVNVSIQRNLEISFQRVVSGQLYQQ